MPHAREKRKKEVGSPQEGSLRTLIDIEHAIGRGSREVRDLMSESERTEQETRIIVMIGRANNRAAGERLGGVHLVAIQDHH